MRDVAICAGFVNGASYFLVYMKHGSEMDDGAKTTWLINLLFAVLRQIGFGRATGILEASIEPDSHAGLFTGALLQSSLNLGL